MRASCSVSLVALLGLVVGLLGPLGAWAQTQAPVQPSQPPELAQPAQAPEPAQAPVVSTPAAAPPPAQTLGSERGATRNNSAAQVARDGTFLPLTLSARVGDQYVMGMAMGGYDGVAGQGGRMTGVVEGALYNRIAIRVSMDYASGADQPTLSAGLRLGLLRQEQHHLDVGFVAMYKNEGFTESHGEIEMGVTLGRRWNRFALFGNLIYGQGFEVQERDGEVRLAALYAVHHRVNVGLDARGRFDLGSSASAQALSGDAPFDLLAGPVATASVGPVSFLAQVGFHTAVYDSQPTTTGAVAMAGVGAAY